MNSFSSIFALIVSSARGDSCNYYATIGIAEDYCNVFTSGNYQESVMFTCVDESNGYLTFWDNDDCSGDANSTRTFNDTSRYTEFSCSTNDDSCSIISLTISTYSGSSDCTGDADGPIEYVYYMTDNSIDCEEDANYNDDEYYTRTLSVSDGLWIGYYDDDSCNDLTFNTTIENGHCETRGGNSTGYTFETEDSGGNGSGSDSDSSDALSQKRNITLMGLFVMIVCLNIMDWLIVI